MPPDVVVYTAHCLTVCVCVYAWCTQLPPDADNSSPVFSSECLNLAVQLIARLDQIEQYE